MSVFQNIEKKQEEVAEKIPEALIYEVVRGEPIYYRGYQEVLNGTKTLEQIMGESTLQSWLKTYLPYALIPGLTTAGYEILGGELGLRIALSETRSADLAIFKSEKLVLDEHYAQVPPEIVIEIDVTAELIKQTEIDYVADKIDDYLRFGVQKVIWIFTRKRKVMIATATPPWLTYGWEQEIEVLPGITFQLEKLLGHRLKK